MGFASRILGKPRDSSTNSPRPGRLGILVGAAGAALVATGAVAVFISTNSTGTGALLAAGVLLIAIGVFGDRIESFEAGGVKLQLAKLLEDAEFAQAAGDFRTARRLRREAAELLEAATSLAQRYVAIRESGQQGEKRTAQLDALIQESSRELSSAFTSKDAVRRLFQLGEEGYRIAALGMMEANPALADSDSIAEAITDPRAPYEQYRALLAANAYAGRLKQPPELEQVREAVKAAQSVGLMSKAPAVVNLAESLVREDS